MLLAMTLIAMVPFGITWYINHQTTIQRITEHVNSQLDRVTEGLIGFVDTWVEMNVRMLKQNAALPAIQSMDGDTQKPILDLIAREYDWNYLALTIAPYGQNIGRSDNKKLKFYGDRAYLKQVMRGAPLAKQVLIGKTSGKPSFVLAVPIKRENGTIKGVLAIGMTIATLSKRITQVRIGETGRAFLVDENGKVIAHQSVEYTKKRKDLSSHPAVVASNFNHRGNLTYVNENGKRMVGSVRTTRYGWKLVAEQEYDEAFAAITQANRNTLVLLGTTLVIVIFVALLLSRRLSIPIQRLTTIADGISRGKLSKKIDYVTHSDEIGALAHSIERLQTSVRLALQRITKDQNKPDVKSSTEQRRQNRA